MAEENKVKLYGKTKESGLSKLLDITLPIRKNLRDLEEENEKLKAFVSTLPVEYCGWDKNGARATSLGFAELLGLDTVNTISDINYALDPADAASLETLFEHLQKNDENFEINLYAQKSGKTLKAFGKNGIIADGQNKFSVIWLYDITAFTSSATNAVNALKDAENREAEIRAAVNAMPFPIWLHNLDLDIIWCNKFYSNVVEESSASIIAEQKELSLSDREKKPLSIKSLAKKSLATDGNINIEGKTFIDGKKRFVEVKEIPLKKENIILGLALDITHQEELRDEHKRLVKSYHEALEQLSTAVAMYDAEAKLEFYNSAYEQATGINASWLNNRPRITDVIDKMREFRKVPEQADYRQYKQSWLERFTSLIDPLEEMQYLPDGKVSRMIVVPRPQGGLMITIEDVTSHMQLETSYNTLMEVQKETMNNLAEAIAVFGEDGRLKLYNSAFSNMWNIMPELLANNPHITKIVDAIKSEPRAEQLITELKSIIKSNALNREPRSDKLRTADGRIIKFSVMPLPDGNILNAYSDITASIKVEEALRERNEAMQAAEKLKTDFIANVSYQLRTPLNSIIGFAEMLKQQYMGALNDKQINYMGNILEASERLKSLINDILDLSSIEAGQLELYYAKINAKTLIENIIDITQPWGRKNHIEMQTNFSHDKLFFEVDETRIKQVLLNLISNAFNFSPNGSKVIITATEVEEDIIITVKDNGLGINKDELNRVFTPFDKISSGKTTSRSGAGLGLTLVKNIVELHGGKIAIESQENSGTTVIVTLPKTRKIVE